MARPPTSPVLSARPLVLCAALCLVAACERRPEQTGPVRLVRTRPIMSTVARIVVWGDRSETAHSAIDAAFAELDRVSSLMDPYQADSEISRVNRQASDRPVEVSAGTFEVVRRACAWSRQTDGAFDVTVGPLISLWRRAAKQDRLPTDAELTELHKRIGWRHIVLDPGPRTIRFGVPGLRLDLGGIAKGYAIDRALSALRRPVISAALVDVGGDLACFGTPPDRDGWVIGVQNPYRDELLGTLRVRDVAVTTSGHYRRFYTVRGKRYSHIFNPLTGRPAQTIASVTVVAPTAMDADAMSTAVSVLGVEKGLALLDKTPDAEGLLVVGSPDTHTFRFSRDWRRYHLSGPAPPAPDRPATRPPPDTGAGRRPRSRPALRTAGSCRE